MRLFTNWKTKYREIYEELRVSKALLDHANNKTEELQKQIRTLKREKRLAENQVDTLKFQVVGLEKKLDNSIKTEKSETISKKKVGRPKKVSK